MTIYAYVEDNEVKEVHHALPMNWKNVSGFNTIGDDADVLLTFGWYIVENNVPEYDSTLYSLDAPSYIFDGSKVVAQYTLSELPKPDYIALQSAFLINMRLERDARLSRSDWTMTTDILEIKDKAWQDLWKNYRQQLRDFPSTFKFGETDLPPDLNSVDWPATP